MSVPKIVRALRKQIERKKAETSLISIAELLDAAEPEWKRMDKMMRYAVSALKKLHGLLSS